MDPRQLTLRPLLAYYLGATPLFFLLDVAWDVTVRASFFDDLPLRLAYYGFCLICGYLSWLLPRRAPLVGLAESALTLTLLVVTFMAPILTLPEQVLADPRAPVAGPTMERVANFALAGGVAWWSFQRWARQTRRTGGPGFRSR